MALSREQKNILKVMVQGEPWDVLKSALVEYVLEIKMQDVNGTTEFETLRMLFKNYGGVEHLNTFFEKIEQGNI